MMVDERAHDLTLTVGFCCPEGHSCLYTIQRAINRRSRDAWRKDLPTYNQISYLRALGYAGPEPKTKGEASDLLKARIEGAALGIPAEIERPIIVRKRGPKEGPAK